MKQERDKNIHWSSLNVEIKQEKLILGLANILTLSAKDYDENFSVNAKRLKYLSGQKNREQLYCHLLIPPKRGGTRKLSIPSKKIRFIQRLLLDFLSDLFCSHKTAIGFVKRNSIVKHSKIHSKKKYVICFDLKDVFPTINWARIYGMFQKYLFYANKELTRIIANFLTFFDEDRIDNILPQGSSLSPFFANMIYNNNELNPIYIHFQLKLTYPEIRNLTGNNDRSGLNLTIPRELTIDKPDITLQNKFAEIVEKKEKLKLKYEQSLTKAENLFNSLMQKTFREEL